jgi:SAM-dependent methyltransferase
MNIADAVFARGKIAGVFPSLSSRRDEVYAEFIEDARNILMHAQQGPIAEYSRSLLKQANKSLAPDPHSTREATEFLMRDPTLRTYYRVKRSLQESFYTCIQDSFERRREDLERALDEADSMGPGTVEYDGSWEVPEYARAQIHLQPRGYADESLAGFIYDYGLKVFMGGAADHGMLYEHLAKTVATPADKVISKALDLGCSAGGCAIALKKRYPESKVYGIDIAAPMVRYAHLQAVEQQQAIHFRQMPAEALRFPDNTFDVAVATLLFHEVPVPISKKIIAEVFRVLRPGGVFTLLDFSGDRSRDVYSMFFAEMDAADNGEPYLPDYVRSNVEDLLEAAGFNLLSYDPKAALMRGRVVEKPTQ